MFDYVFTLLVSWSSIKFVVVLYVAYNDNNLNLLIGDVNVLFTDFPIAASFPHFLHAESSVQESIIGLTPNKEKHGSFVIVEPVSYDNKS